MLDLYMDGSQAALLHLLNRIVFPNFGHPALKFSKYKFLWMNNSEKQKLWTVSSKIFPEPEITFYIRTIMYSDSFSAVTWPVEPMHWTNESRIQCCFDVDIVYLLINSYMGSQISCECELWQKILFYPPYTSRSLFDTDMPNWHKSISFRKYSK